MPAEREGSIRLGLVVLLQSDVPAERESSWMGEVGEVRDVGEVGVVGVVGEMSEVSKVGSVGEVCS